LSELTTTYIKNAIKVFICQ